MQSIPGGSYSTQSIPGRGDLLSIMGHTPHSQSLVGGTYRLKWVTLYAVNAGGGVSLYAVNPWWVPFYAVNPW